jgi:hypothetical protein
MPNYTLEDVAKALCAKLMADYVVAVGHGAFKETFCICDNHGSTKALKILKPGCSAERTEREIEAMTRCSHPNVAPLEKLAEFEFLGSDVDTSDPSDENWWIPITENLAKLATELQPSALCSPAVVPRAFPNDYYDLLTKITKRLSARLKDSNQAVVQTAVASFSDLAVQGRALTIASILSRSPSERLFIVLVGNTEPRRELADPEELKGAMRLINALAEAGLMVTVGFSSSEMILWKAAGAQSCATGKFFNLRRFTITRFAEPGGGGGQIPYWFEESLLAFLRQSDLLRVRQRELLSSSSKANPFGDQILPAIPSKTPWLGLGWRQFLHWFADAEHRLENALASAEDLVSQADENWAAIEESRPRIFMEERANDGTWIRQWRRALEEFPYFE